LLIGMLLRRICFYYGKWGFCWIFRTSYHFYTILIFCQNLTKLFMTIALFGTLYGFSVHNLR
jgi:hypothetical protein